MKHIISVKGSIVSNDEAWIYNLFEIEHTSPESIDKSISEANGKEILVEINSGGGSVFAGSEIYTKLKKLNVDVEIIGLAGSAASFIAMAGKSVSISPTAQIMIHNASTISVGDKNDMSDTSEFLNSIDIGIAHAYQSKTTLSQNEILEMMSKETWLNAQEAVEKGFADEIMFAEPKDAVASVGLTLPQNVINKVRNVLNKEPVSKTDERLANIEKQLDNLNKKIEEETKQLYEPVNNWLF